MKSGTKSQTLCKVNANDSCSKQGRTWIELTLSLMRISLSCRIKSLHWIAGISPRLKLFILTTSAMNIIWIMKSKGKSKSQLSAKKTTTLTKILRIWFVWRSRNSKVKAMTAQHYSALINIQTQSVKELKRKRIYNLSGKNSNLKFTN